MKIYEDYRNELLEQGRSIENGNDFLELVRKLSADNLQNIKKDEPSVMHVLTNLKRSQFFLNRIFLEEKDSREDEWVGEFVYKSLSIGIGQALLDTEALYVDITGHAPEYSENIYDENT